MKLSLLHDNLITVIPGVCKIARGAIRGYIANKNYYYINVVCIQIVLYWGTNQECGIN